MLKKIIFLAFINVCLSFFLCNSTKTNQIESKKSNGYLFLSDKEDYLIKIKFIPFSTESQLPIDEESLKNYQESGNYIQVKTINIVGDSLTKVIINKLNLLTKGDKEIINLRMECKIYRGKNLLDSFFINNRKQLVYKNKVYESSFNIIELIMENMCRPLYSYFSAKESLFWSDDMKSCNDSNEFINLFGKEIYNNIDWVEKKESSKEYKKKYQIIR